MIPTITRNQRHLFTMRLIAVVGVAWLVLAGWSVSPYAPYLNHEILEHLPFTLSVEYVTLLLIFVAGWMLMVVAMMLPGILPAVTRFQGEVERMWPVALLLAGYVGVWTVFGGLAHLSDVVVHEATHRLAWLGANEWVLSAALLTVAGVYQFTPLKRAYLEACRSPLHCITEQRRGRQNQRHAAQMGVQHGLSCVGCCGPLMLLMFGVACGNVLVMLGLGTIMVAEKHVPWGRQITAALGVVLLGGGVVVSLISIGVI